MAMRYKTRRRLSIFVLVIGLPAWIIASVTLMTWLFPDPLDKPPILVELAIYIGFGVIWALPLRSVFKGVGKADPDDPAGPQG